MEEFSHRFQYLLKAATGATSLANDKDSSELDDSQVLQSSKPQPLPQPGKLIRGEDGKLTLPRYRKPKLRRIKSKIADLWKKRQGNLKHAQSLPTLHVQQSSPPVSICTTKANENAINCLNWFQFPLQSSKLRPTRPVSPSGISTGSRLSTTGEAERAVWDHLRAGASWKKLFKSFRSTDQKG